VAIRVVRLGTPRHPQEGPRLGTVRRPPRGVKKTEYAAGNWYDVWVPDLSPTAALVSEALDIGMEDEAAWRRFERAYVAEMKQPSAARLLDLLATLSHTSNFSVGCYCADARRCHRSILRRLLAERGADVVMV
jgi:uncharacterized protein YeaO (DUF488 family)